MLESGANINYIHVLPNGFVKIRHYGILSNRNRKTKLENCKKLLGVSTQNKLKSKAKEKCNYSLIF
jgi:hypothetical protein